MQATDFAKGKVWQNIIVQSIPLILAQLVQLLYNVVDRIYIGHLPGADSMALTGIGLVFPLTTLIAAFTFLFGTGGTPLFSIARGAGKEERAEKILGNTFSLLFGTSLMLLLSIFTDDTAMIEAGVGALRLYFFGFFFMAFQFTGQSTFTALGYSRYAIFFSLLRKAIIVAPLTILLPRLGLGVNGVFLAEPISNAIGGLACFVTMYFALYRKLKTEGT